MKYFVPVFFLLCLLAPSQLAAASADDIVDRMKGRILLQTEERGEAWYVNPSTGMRYYLKTGHHAFEALRLFGLGVSNADIWKILVGVSPTASKSYDTDGDGDGLGNSMEHALGTIASNSDTDGDGYTDSVEYTNGYDPFGSGTIPLDEALTNQLKGNILLQVESAGEAWYVNPEDGRRYYMRHGLAAYDLMRHMSVGITNADLAMIPIDPDSPLPPTQPWTSYSVTQENFTLSMDFPSDSLVTIEDESSSTRIEEGFIEATILKGKSRLQVEWREGDHAVRDFLGDSVDENRCTPMTYGMNSGTECLGVTRAGMNAFLFRSAGKTFLIYDQNWNVINEFYGHDWWHILESVVVTAR